MNDQTNTQQTPEQTPEPVTFQTPEEALEASESEMEQYMQDRAEKMKGRTEEDAQRASQPLAQQNTTLQPEGTDGATAAPQGDQPQQDGTDDAQASDGSAGDGKSDAKPGKDGDLPIGVKRRLERERKKAVREEEGRKAAEQQVAELRKQLEAAIANQEAKANAPPPEGDSPQQQTSDEDEPEDPYEGLDDDDLDDVQPYPQQANYSTHAEWMEDVKRWEEGKPTAYSQKQAGQQPDPAANGQTPTAQQQQEPPSMAELLGPALDEAMDEYEGNDNLRDDFREMIGNGQITVTNAMLERMGSSDDGAEIANIFVNRPRESRRIAYLPTSKQAEALDKLLESASAETPATQAQTQPASAQTPVPETTPFINGANLPTMTQQQQLMAAGDEESYMELHNRERARRGLI